MDATTKTGGYIGVVREQGKAPYLRQSPSPNFPLISSKPLM